MTILKRSWRRATIVATSFGLAACSLTQSGCGAEDDLLPVTSKGLLLGTTDYGDIWKPYWEHEHSVYFRNNKLTDFQITSAQRSSSSSGCSTSEYDFVNGTSVSIPASRVVEVLNVDSGDCRNSSNVWKFNLTQSSCSGTTYSLYVRGDGRVSTNGTTFASSSTNTSLSFCGSSVTVNLQGRGSFYGTGVYITIGADSFGDLGPSRDASSENKLTVTSYNTYLGTDSKPERCERAEALKSALSSINSDVLVLEEMNLRESGCTDGLELAAYLWTGDGTEAGDDALENNSYANSTSGTGTSPQKAGVFPYISQFVSGIAVNGDESETGGVVILSKYPVTMIKNSTFPGSHRKTAEQKGFLVAKVTKGTKDYYVVATHPDATSSYRDDQIGDIRSYLTTTGDIPASARVILAGDLNTDGKDGELANIGVSLGYASATNTYASQTNTQYFALSRYSPVNFYKCCKGNENIDWVQPMSSVNPARSFTAPSSFSWYVHPVRDVNFKFTELSDHFAVTGMFTY